MNVAPSEAPGRRGTRLLFGLFLLFLAWNYFYGIRHFPHPHGDEYSLLNIPYRFVRYGDLRFTAFYTSSFGSQEIRCSPPVAAFTLRNLYHSVVGFSPVQSRVFSALLFFAVVVTVPIYLRRAGLTPAQGLPVLCQIALAPVFLLAARSMRTEQEVLAAGWFGAVALPALIPALPARARPAGWILAGTLVALAGASHPIGTAYGVAVVWLVATGRRWREWDGLRLRQRLALLGLGAAVVAVPTALWMADGDKRRFVTHVNDLYQTRDQQLAPLLAAGPPWNRLQGTLPDRVVARLNLLHAASYSDYFGYPVRNYRFRGVLSGWFYVQLFLVVGYFFFSLRRGFRNANPWVHLSVLLAVAFLVVILGFFPVFTYGVYLACYVNLAAGVIVWRVAARLRSAVPRFPAASRALVVLYLAATALVLHYTMRHAWHVTAAVHRGEFPNVSVDQEFAALDEMAGRVGLNRAAGVVYTSSESWIAGGKNAASMRESVMLGLVDPEPDASGAVFKNAHLNFFSTGFGADIVSKYPTRAERIRRLDQLLGRLHLHGLILNEWSPVEAYSLYTDAPPPPGQLLVARMRRSLHTDYQTALLQEEVRAPTNTRLAAGQYVLCVWTETDPEGGVLEVRTGADAGRPVRVALGPISSVVPVPVFLDVAASGDTVDLTGRSGDRPVPLRKLQVYRLASPE